ncbi:DegT/DnrJ/EryC1/StrS family aminotransferase, partial [bacterium]|nr:DegT/DnrJ/EryC1/StrS family aminotransferase [bacterium]
YDVVELGYNYRMDDLRASIGIVQLKRLKDDLVKRAYVREFYLEALKNIAGIIIPFADNKEFVSNYILPIVLRDSTSDNRDKVRDVLHKCGIQTSIHYPAIHRFSIYRDYKAKLPRTDCVTDNEITLPMYSKMSKIDVQFIADALKATL